MHRITTSLPTRLATVVLGCLLAIVYGPVENGGGVAAWTNDILPKLKLKYGKWDWLHQAYARFFMVNILFVFTRRARETSDIFRQPIGLFSNSGPRRSFAADWCKVISITLGRVSIELNI